MPVIELEAYVPPTAVVRKDSTGAKIHLRERDGDILCGAGKKLIADVWEEVASPPVDDPSWCKRCRAAESSIPRLKRVAGASGTALREKAEAALVDPAEVLARRFHEAYERLAPDFGYETRPESAVPWEQVPEANRRLMIAVVKEVML